MRRTQNCSTRSQSRILMVLRQRFGPNSWNSSHIRMRLTRRSASKKNGRKFRPTLNNCGRQLRRGWPAIRTILLDTVLAKLSDCGSFLSDMLVSECASHPIRGVLPKPFDLLHTRYPSAKMLSGHRVTDRTGVQLNCERDGALFARGPKGQTWR